MYSYQLSRRRCGEGVGQAGCGFGASGVSLKVGAKLNLQVQMWHVCCLKDAQLSIFIWIKYGWSRGHEPAGNKLLRQTESIIICHWNAFIAGLDLFIMISWGLIWALFLCFLSLLLLLVKNKGIKGLAFHPVIHNTCHLSCQSYFKTMI